MGFPGVDRARRRPDQSRRFTATVGLILLAGCGTFIERSMLLARGSVAEPSYT